MAVSKMNLLLTGGGGSIGVHFIAHTMINTTWSITLIDSFRHKGEYDRVARVVQDNPEWRERITTITHDLTAPFTDRQIDKLKDADYIVHLASLSDVQASIDDPVPFIRNNVDITLNTLELARKINPKAFVLFSTDEVYGPAIKERVECREPECPDDAKPLGERDHKHEYIIGHSEWDTIVPSNPYSASKASQEAIAIAYWRSYNVPVIITNTMNNFGEMQQSNKYPVKIQKWVTDGEEIPVHAAHTGEIGTRFYIHSRNTADAILFILQNTTPTSHAPGQMDRPDRYNIVGDIQLDNLQLAQVIAELMGKELKHKPEFFHESNPGHDLHYGLDGNKLKDLGWTPPVDFKTSMKNTIEWQQNNPEWIA